MITDKLIGLGAIGVGIAMIAIGVYKLNVIKNKRKAELLDLAGGRRITLHITDVVNGERVHSLYYSDKETEAHVENYPSLDEAINALLAMLEA